MASPATEKTGLNQKGYLTEKASLSPEFWRRCERTAAEQRGLLGLPLYAPLPGAAFVACHSGVLRTPEELPGATPEKAAQLSASRGWWGALLSLPPEPYLLLNPNQPPTRRESTIMHEMAHFLLKHAPACFDPETALPLRSPQNELEAAYLGGCLQLPQVALVWAQQSDLTIRKTALHFGASERMVTYRANIMGVRLKK